MSLTTGQSAVDDNGDLAIYVPPGVTAQNKGYGVVNGIYNQVNAGETAQLAGVVQIPGGSGQFQVVEGGTLIYRPVTITAGPPTGPVQSILPQTTGTVGRNAAGLAFVYSPPNLDAVASGSTVTFGSWVTLQEFETLPVPSIVEVAAGAATVQAVNLALWRQVTITPL